MASRYTGTEIWDEDWFCEMPGEYQLFTKYVFDKCDNAGVWKPNKFDFEIKSKFKVRLDLLFKYMNAGTGGGFAQRVLLLENGRWFLTGYILFQWFNKKKTFDLALSNRLHKSLYEILVNNKIDLKKVRGLREVLETSMVMVMSMDTKGIKEKEGVEGKTIKGASEMFAIDPDWELSVLALEAVQRNQVAHTRSKNTSYIKDQWKVFLAERVADPPERQLRKLSDVETYFINWMRGKFPIKVKF